MNARTNNAPRVESAYSTADIDPAAYAEFIQGIELMDIRLERASLAGPSYRTVPEHMRVSISADAALELTEAGFIARQTYRFDGYGNGEDHILSIDATFGLAFRSVQPMTDALFSVFQDVNLPVNSWPYFREFVANCSARMGWEPFTLPTLKRGIPNDRVSETPAEPKPKRARTRKPKQATPSDSGA